jgi:hypothetical protein
MFTLSIYGLPYISATCVPNMVLGPSGLIFGHTWPYILASLLVDSQQRQLNEEGGEHSC